MVHSAHCSPKIARKALRALLTGAAIFAAFEVTASAKNLTWTGDVDGVLNNNWTLTGTPTNWKDNSTGVAASFLNGDTVLFDNTGRNDTAGSPITITIGGSVAPASVTFNNSDADHNYIFQGTGKITGASTLTKNGSGTVTLATANDYTGAVTINAGTLQVGDGTTAGAKLGGGGTVTVAAGAKLAYNLSTAAGSSVTLRSELGAGRKITGNGTFVKMGSGTLEINEGYAALLSTTKTEIRGGVLNLTTVGGTTGSIRGAISIYSGGTLLTTASNAMGYNGGDQRISAMTIDHGTWNHTGSGDACWGVIFDLTGATLKTTGGAFSLGGPGGSDTVPNSVINVKASNDTPTTITGNIALRNPSGMTEFNVEQGTTTTEPDLLISGGTVTNSAGITKNGAGYMKIDATGAGYTGATIVNGGKLEFTNAAPTGSTAITVNAGTLEFKAGNPTAATSINAAGGTIKFSGATALSNTSTSLNVANGGVAWFSGGAPTIGSLAMSPGGIVSLSKNASDRTDISSVNTLTLGGVSTGSTPSSYAGRTRTTSEPAVDIYGNLKVTGGHTLVVGNVNGIDTLKIAGDLEIAGASVMFSIGNPDAVDALKNDLVISNRLTFSGSNTFKIISTTGELLTGKTYDLFKYNQSFGAISLGTPIVDDGIGRLSTSVSNPGVVTLTIEKTNNQLIWNATSSASNEWNNSASGTVNKNWSNGGTTGYFADLDKVTFDDGHYGDVKITSAVKPILIIVNNSTANNYTLTNSGGHISGNSTSINKQGSGTLTLTTTDTTVNDFAGAFRISGGTVVLSDSNATGAKLIGNDGEASLIGKGTGPGSIIIENNAKLSFSGTTNVASNRTFTIGTGGATLQTVNATANYIYFSGGIVGHEGTGDRTLTLDGVGGQGNVASSSGAVGGAIVTKLTDMPGGGKLSIIKSGTGVWALQGSNTFTGNVTVKGTPGTAGMLVFGNDSALGAIPTSFNAQAVVLDGGNLFNAASNASTFASGGAAVTISQNRGIYLTANGGGIRIYGGASFTVNSIISGPGQLTVWDGASPLILNASNTYSGGTRITSASKIQTNNKSAVGVGLVQLNNAGAIIEIASNNLEIMKLGGSGIVQSVAGITNELVLHDTSGTFTGRLRDDSAGATAHTGVLSLRKVSSGIASLGGQDKNEISGQIIVEAGTLKAAKSSNVAAFGDSVSIGVYAGGTLDLNSTEEIIGVGRNGTTKRTLFLAGSGSGTAGALTSDGTAGSADRTVSNTYIYGDAVITIGAQNQKSIILENITSLSAGTILANTIVPPDIGSKLTDASIPKSLTLAADTGGGNGNLTISKGLSITGRLTVAATTNITSALGTVTVGTQLTSPEFGIVIGTTGVQTAATAGNLILKNSNIISPEQKPEIQSGSYLTLGNDTAKNATAQTVAGLRGTGTITHGIDTNTSNFASLALNIEGSISETFAGKIGSDGSAGSAQLSLTKSGSGTLILSGEINNYTGTTRISAGILEMNAPMSGTDAGENPIGVLGVPTAENGNILIADSATLRYKSTTKDSYTNRLLTLGIPATTPAGVRIEVEGSKVFAFTGTGAITSPSGGKLILAGNGSSLGNLFAPSLTEAAAPGLSLEKQGTSEWTLGAPATAATANTAEIAATANNYTGGTFIKNGTLTLGVANALSQNSKLVLGDAVGATDGVLKLSGYNQELSGLTVDSERVNSSVVNTTLAGKDFGTLTLNIDSGTNSYAGRFGGSTPSTSNLINRFNLVKNGNGTLELSGTMNYAGTTNVTGGRLSLIGDANTLLSTNITIAGTGAQLRTDNSTAQGVVMGYYGSLTGDQTLTAGGTPDNIDKQLLGTYTITTRGILNVGGTSTASWLNIGDNGDGKNTGGILNLDGGSVIFTLAASADKTQNDLISVDKLSVTTSTTRSVNIQTVFKDGRISTGKYLLFRYESFAGNINNLKPLQSGSRYILSIENDLAGKSVWLNVTGDTQNPIYWVGANGNQWGDGAPAGNGTNFHATPKSSDTAYIAYNPGDYAIFDDTASNYNVSIAENGVNIGHITVDTEKTYTFSGGPISDSPDGNPHYIEKLGKGTLTLAGANGYSGGTFIGDGMVLVKNNASLGVGDAYLQGGTLGIGGNLTIDNNISPNAFGGSIYTEYTPTFTGTFSTPKKEVGGREVILSKTGYGTIHLANADGKSFAGTFNINAGGIAFDVAANYYDAAFNLLGENARLVAGYDTGTAKIGSLAGSATSNVTASGAGLRALEIGARGENTIFAGTITDGTGATLAITKVGNGTLILTGNNTYTGDTNINAGTIQIGDGGTTGNISGSVINIAAGGILAFNKSIETVLTQAINSAPGGTLAQLGTGTLYVPTDKPTLAGTVKIGTGSTIVVGQNGSANNPPATGGTLGTSIIETDGKLVYNHSAAELTVANTIKGTGDIYKQGANKLVYTGDNSSTGTTYVEAGTLQIGEGEDNTSRTTPQAYNSGVIQVATGAVLDLSPANPATLILASNITAINSIINKNTAGTVILTGNTSANGVFNVTAGKLQIGNATGGVDSGSLSGILNLYLADTAEGLIFDRSGIATISAIISGGPTGSERTGPIQQKGGGTVILSAYNKINNSSITVTDNSTLQVGDGTSGRLTDPAVGTLTVSLESGSTLAYNLSKDPNSTSSTEAGITIDGAGNFEQRGIGTLVLASTANYTGNTIASAGRLSIPTNNLPAGFTDPATDPTGGYLDARAGATIELRHADTTTPFTFEGRIKGDGTIALGADPSIAAGSYVSYTYNSNGNPNTLGTLAIEKQTHLNLGTNAAAPVNTKLLEIRSGGMLEGSGTIGKTGTPGTLVNLTGGTISPGGENQIGRINITGDFINEGNILLEITGSGTGENSYHFDSIHYTGNAAINGAGIEYDMSGLSQETKNWLTANHIVIPIIAGDEKATATNLARPEDSDGNSIGFVYNNGSHGLALIFADSIADIPGIAGGLHDGLGNYINALNTMPDNGVVSALLSSDNQAQAINNASPLGFASMTAMSITSAHDSSAALRNHLESLRYEHARTGTEVDLAPYVTATGIVADNGSGHSNPTFDFNTYGGLVGLDHSFTKELLGGINAGYNHGKATFHDNGGNVTQDNARVQIYGTYMISDWIYIDAAGFFGYSSYDIQHNTVGGSAKGDTTGFDGGFNAFVGGIAPVSKTIHFTPYFGFEYTHAEADAFTEKNSALGLAVDSLSQDSLRVKIGTGLNWLAITGSDFNLRLGLDMAYAHELLDSDTDITARFLAGGDKFKVSAASTPEDSVMVGPQIEFGFDGNKSLSFGYTFEYDLESQYIHHLNATFRMRF